MPDVYIPTENLRWVSSCEAQWIAVDALFISRSREIPFEDVYFGNLSRQHKLWIEKEIRNGLTDIPAREVIFHFETDHLRKLLEEMQNSAISVIEKDVEPLRLVLEGVMHGGTKNRVMSRVSEVYRQHYGPEINNDPVVSLNPTKTPNLHIEGSTRVRTH